MCRECVRAHFEAVGGIPGLYHDKWTEDLHRDNPPVDEEDLAPVEEYVEMGCGVTVMYLGEGNVQLDGQCPRCDEDLHVKTHTIHPGEPDDTRRVGVACHSCTWSRDVDLPR